MAVPQYESIAELYQDLLSSERPQKIGNSKSSIVNSKTRLLSSYQASLVRKLEKYRGISALTFTTIISSCLLAGNVLGWTVSNEVYDTILKSGATIEFIIQLVANIFGAIHIGIICLLIQYSTRLWISSSKISLELLHFWNDLLTQKLNWNHSIRFLTPLIIFSALCTLPCALWAGAIAPVPILTHENGSMLISSWGNTTLLHQNYNNRSGLPSVQTLDGFFTFGVGESFMSSLLSSASSATTIDGSVRRHSKQDLTGFIYLGRSYGVGSTVGLSILSFNNTINSRTQRYSYIEPGYNSQVTCVYNSSSAYVLSSTPYGSETMVFVASGLLPNSNGIEEYARYASYSSDAIVAIGVASSPTSKERILGITAGKNYANLNNTQCTIHFQPTIFEVDVDLVNKTIGVKAIPSNNVADIEPTGFLTFLANWQFWLISTDQSRLYSSLIGDSIFRNIQNYITFTAAMNRTVLSLSEATLPGLQNSIEAMIDDILVGYSASQAVVGGQRVSIHAIMHNNTFQLGEKRYIIAIVGLNTILILVFMAEAIRTRGWKGLVEVDYMSTRDLVLGIKRGVEDGGDPLTDGDQARLTKPKTKTREDGKVYVRQRGETFEIVAGARWRWSIDQQ
jgi:hypothetical protein